MDVIKDIKIPFGKSFYRLKPDYSAGNWDIIEPDHARALKNPQLTLKRGCESPVGTPDLYSMLHPSDKVTIVTSDITRPVPNKFLISFLLEKMPIEVENVSICVGNGSHRQTTDEELSAMFGRKILNRVKIVNHDSFDREQNQWMTKLSDGSDVYLNKAYVEADKRIILGFIEPHFFAGYSGGAKAVVPGVAGIDTILSIHNASLIRNKLSTWAHMEFNPIQKVINEAVSSCPPEFLINVSLNPDKSITEIFCGDYKEAHTAGCEFVKEKSMVRAAEKYDIVITSNSGYPLDQNLYQTVKGISAAARITKEGGAIFIISQCKDGVPSHGNFYDIMTQGSSAQDVLDWIFSQSTPVLDQWQAQILADILLQHQVYVHSELDDDTIRQLKLIPAKDFEKSLNKYIAGLGKKPDIAVLAQGPVCVPYIEK